MFSAGEGFVEALRRRFQDFDFGEVIWSLWGFVECVKASLDALNSLWDFKFVLDGFLEPTFPAAGFVCDFDGSERAWDRGAFATNSSACDKWGALRARKQALNAATFRDSPCTVA